MGIPTTTSTESRVLSPTYQVDKPTPGHLQTHRLKIRVAALGPSQEQTRHELRNDGPSSPVSICLMSLPSCRVVLAFTRDADIFLTDAEKKPSHEINRSCVGNDPETKLAVMNSLKLDVF